MAFNHYWPMYKNLEEEVIELTKYVQFTDDQLGVYSIHIADLLVRCAMEIEAISKELYWENGGTTQYDEDGKERKLFFDTDCIALINNIWGICDKRIIVSATKFYFEKDENRELTPLHKSYKRGGAKWNKAYQAVKHDRRNCLKQGNIKNLLDAMGALFILNLYYSNQVVPLGVTQTPSKDFDSRLGSELFSATVADATINISMGGCLTDDAMSSELKMELKDAIYVLKYTDKSWKDINSGIESDNQNLVEQLSKSKEFISYAKQNNLNSEPLISLVSKFLGTDYISKHNAMRNFGFAFMNAQKEAVMVKKEPIYG